MKNKMIKFIAILIVVGFAATSFAVMGNYGVNSPYEGKVVNNIVKPMVSNGVIDTITVGTEPEAVAFDSLNGNVYVSNYYSNNVTVINDTNKVIDTITVGSGPEAVAFDSLNGYVYVANAGSNSVSVISPTYVEYQVIFSQTGLPSGTVWYVTLGNGSSGFSLSSTLYLSLPNGTYSYTVATADHIYKPFRYSGEFTVNGTSLVVPVKFTEVTYSVTFTESGLPSGSTWYVNLSNGQTLSSTASNISVSEPNETYIYTVAVSNHLYAPSAGLGFLTVNGKPVSESIKFSKITYSVTFIESGLITGTNWYVNITENNNTVHDSGAISGSSYSLSLSNGTYTYTIATSDKTYEPSQPSGSFTVNGSSVIVSATFFEVKYSIAFTESNLSSGTSWSVTLNGTTLSSTTSTITFSMPNGTYSYTVSNVSGYSVSTSSGSVTVNGSSESITISFTSINKSSPSPGISNTDLYIIIGIVAAAAVIGAAVTIMIRKRK